MCPQLPKKQKLYHRLWNFRDFDYLQEQLFFGLMGNSNTGKLSVMSGVNPTSKHATSGDQKFSAAVLGEITPALGAYKDMKVQPSPLSRCATAQI